MPGMTTHRSLNKLEFKAHMSIHNKVEVSDSQMQDSNRTRDRFGKSHSVSEAGLRPRRRLAKKVFSFLALILLTDSFALAAHRSTDVQVESGSVDELIDKKINPPKERFAFYRDSEKSLEINEDGDPNMNLRF